MEQLIITIDGKANADLVMRMMQKFNFVKSVLREKISKTANNDILADEYPEEYNWINPKRPATDDEFEKMISDAEAEYNSGQGLTSEKARALTLKKITEWKKQNIM